MSSSVEEIAATLKEMLAAGKLATAEAEDEVAAEAEDEVAAEAEGEGASSVQLECKKCGVTAGTQWKGRTKGRKICARDFDIDHHTEKEDSWSAENTHAARKESLEQGRSRILCALCHREVSRFDVARERPATAECESRE